MTYPKPKKQQLVPIENNCRLPRISTKEKQSPLNFILIPRKYPYLNPEMHFPNHRNPLIFVIAKLPKVSYPAWGSTGSLVLRAACSWDAHNFCRNETGCKRWKCRDGCHYYWELGRNPRYNIWFTQDSTSFIYQNHQRIFDQVALVLFAQTMRMLGTRVLRQSLLQCMARLCLQLRCGEPGIWGKLGGYSCLAVSKIGGCFTDDIFTGYMYIIPIIIYYIHMYGIRFLFWGDFHPSCGPWRLGRYSSHPSKACFCLLFALNFDGNCWNLSF